jgi:hypothetical protein
MVEKKKMRADRVMSAAISEQRPKTSKPGEARRPFFDLPE